MSSAYIIGSGSIACRHSRILSKLGFKVYCITLRLSNIESVYHQNNFLKILPEIPLPQDCTDIYVVANSTNLHTQTVKKILENGCSRAQIFCEKPGPVEDLGVMVLYNLEYLSINNRSGRKMIKLVHKADAKKWPSDIKWNERYIFRKKLGGGAVKIHSHEIVRAYNSFLGKNIPKFKKENEKFMADIDGEMVQISLDLVGLNILIQLSITADHPQRYWEWEDLVVSFYGEVPSEIKQKEVYRPSVDDINETYERMWISLMKNGENKKSNLSWVHMYG